MKTNSFLKENTGINNELEEISSSSDSPEIITRVGRDIKQNKFKYMTRINAIQKPQLNIAIILSGSIREAFEGDTLYNIIEIFKKNSNICHVFMHTWDTFEVCSPNTFHNIYKDELK